MVYPSPKSKRILNAHPELKFEKQTKEMSSLEGGVLEELCSLAGFLPWTQMVAHSQDSAFHPAFLTVGINN